MAAIPREQIKILYSHPQVFGQCRAWILKHFPDAELVEVSSTTKAAQIARDQPGQGAAALGGPLAAEMYGLTLLEKCIQDRATNTTRFLVIGEKTCPPTGHDRTSILFAIHDRPGSLVNALQAFDHFHINLSKIESRPSKRKDWEYIFYVDLAGHCDDPKVAEALEALSHHCSLVKLLGSYPDAAE
jgi:chorismate mutase/prephenate dehydratase